MGKRSDFERTPSDTYDTPFLAVSPLLYYLMGKPYRRRKTQFIEPCFGAGHLAAYLQRGGCVMVAHYNWPVDARSATYDVPNGAVFITNPPYWGRPNDLHPLIENLSNQAPTWLLMSADWLFNASSGPLTRRLRRIIAVGRVKWIPGSRHTGMENAAWLLFDGKAQRSNGFFVGRR